MTPQTWARVKADFAAKWPPSVIAKLDKQVAFRTWERGLMKFNPAVQKVKIAIYNRTRKMT